MRVRSGDAGRFPPSGHHRVLGRCGAAFPAVGHASKTPVRGGARCPPGGSRPCHPGPQLPHGRHPTAAGGRRNNCASRQGTRTQRATRAHAALKCCSFRQSHRQASLQKAPCANSAALPRRRPRRTPSLRPVSSPRFSWRYPRRPWSRGAEFRPASSCSRICVIALATKDLKIFGPMEWGNQAFMSLQFFWTLAPLLMIMSSGSLI